ncbi:hypothetical protein K504DRAFT_366358 [Pleomassaria siparia CBS 279.74]|uniref:Transcription factor Iwr1 domain-containing protein n=1 Tax=Pleomassaria siparia CBS 279.74 TaxID=1314801 RepID=A0A6G1KPB1_9PLEO|nr:hypothetical protein K504DRAFT_366358 [Pleomassaria siparia CBS 279.74]
MSPNPPQTLSVKRKRIDAPVDSLVVEHAEQTGKRFKSGNFPVYRRIHTPNARSISTQTVVSPATQAPRRFLVDRTTGQRILVEDRPTGQENIRKDAAQAQTPHTEETSSSKTIPAIIVDEVSRPRKRPGPGATIQLRAPSPAAAKARHAKEPSEDLVRQFEKFSDQVAREDSGVPSSALSPSRRNPKPKAPKQRFKDRHPNGADDADAMEIDTDEYVYDTYVREMVFPDANGKMPEPQGTIGFIVIAEEDEEWWNGDDESDREFDTDDEDENAEDYYGNDYPEDELSEDDEYGRDPYQYRKDDDEEYDLGDDDGIEEEKEEPFKQSVPVPLPITPARLGYWGRQGE